MILNRRDAEKSWIRTFAWNFRVSGPRVSKGLMSKLGKLRSRSPHENLIS